MSLTPFDGLTPSRVVWVSTSGSPTGDGSQASPFSSIQAAVNAATPGTAIMVKAGTYFENVQIPHAISGAPSAPIWIESADGPQQAHIIAPDPTLAAIGGGGVQNIVVKDLWITGGLNGVQFSQDGLDWTSLVDNIVIEGDRIDGAVQDGIKANGGDHVYVVGNSISDGETQQGVDFLAVNDSLIANNDVHNILGTTGIYVKGGSTGVTIAGNCVHDMAGDGIGMGNHTGDFNWRPGFSGYEAKDIDVTGNRVSDVGGRALVVDAAVDSQAVDNFFANTGVYNTIVVTSETLSNTVLYCQNVVIMDNALASCRNPICVQPGNGKGLVIQHNPANGAHTVGDALADVISPGKGNAVVWGGAGADTINAGRGAEVFIYAPGDGADRINHFHRGLDHLDLHPIAALYPDLTVSFNDTAKGLQVYADYNGQHELLATLYGVHGGLTQGADYWL